jgi:hypothetical protein
LNIKIDELDNTKKAPLEYCPFEDAFAYKVLANRHDVLILCATKDFAFATQLAQGFFNDFFFSQFLLGIEGFYVKCRILGQMEKDEGLFIEQCRGTLFVCSTTAIKSDDIRRQLKKSKALKKPIFTLFVEKTTFDAELYTFS